MRNSFLDSLKNYLQAANQWLLRTPERALDEAYEAAIAIKTLEDTHFGGNKISPDSGNYGKSAQTYFRSELKRNLDVIKLRLAEFKLSGSIVRLSNQSITEVQLEDNPSDLRQINVIDRPNLILRKLRFIDEVIGRYDSREPDPASVIVVAEANSVTRQVPVARNGRNLGQANGQTNGQANGQANGKPGQLTGQSSGEPTSATNINKMFMEEPAKRKDAARSITDKTGVLPRSILETVDRIKRELDPEAEQEVVRDFRRSKARTIISLRLVLFLIIIPLLTQQVVKSFVVGPIVDQMRAGGDPVQVFLNREMEEEALQELQLFEQRLRFEVLIGQVEPRSEEEISETVKEKAEELREEFREVSADAIKNVFSDLFGLLAFVGVLMTSKRELEVMKSFLDQLIYGLSDSAKAFVIILFTDMFVGFHSPHGWEVLLEGVSRHFGLPANRDFIFLFIATFPVILDTIFKYWIFRYLNRVSPSAVATYKNMNE